ncbi:MAG: OsmC family protein [Acidobacteria bacterium]|nr:OsmC family protein [Acidobacteriota bacterium]
MSTYTAKISWKSDSPENFTKNHYTRGHTWSFDGGIDVPASSSPHSVRIPFSVEAAVDPEEALVAAAASCHMLTFLWVAARKGFRIDSYEDTAVGKMTAGDDRKHWVSKITLDPEIEWVGDTLPTTEEIAEMHHAAHEQCYVANSIKSEIIVKGVDKGHGGAANV